MSKFVRKFRGRTSREIRPAGIQLRVERLEDRLLMSATDSSSTAVQLPLTNFAATALIGPRDLRQTVSSPGATLAKFQSTAQFEQWLIRAAVAEYGSLFGQSTYNYGWNGLGIVNYGGLVAFNSATGPTVDAGSAAFSSTNVQVPGVDEADLVETDGNYLYIISGHDLVIVKAGAAGDLQIASRVHLDETPSGMYLSGDRLALVSSDSSQSSGGVIVAQPLMLVANNFPFGGWEPSLPTTTVTVFDVSDRAAPAVVQKTQLDGQLVGSRVVDGELRLVLANQFGLPAPISHSLSGPMPVGPGWNPQPLPMLPRLQLGDNAGLTLDGATGVVTGVQTTLWWPYQPSTTYVYETQAEYLARVGDQLLAAIQPRVRSIASDGTVVSETPLFDPTQLYQPDSPLDRCVTTIATFDLASNSVGPTSTGSVLTGSPAQVYATLDSVYLFAARSPDAGTSTWGFPAAAATTVWKFAIDSQTHAVSLAATGEFSGTVTSQFNADEQDGYLRVVSTDGAWSGGGQDVFVLQQFGNDLRVVGSLTGIATGEALHSVRFEGNRVFICTFRNFDPLFAVDLTDPTNPQMLGELQIPGYSDYLQPIDANHLLAVGRDVDPSSGEYGPLQVSLFDVTDSTHPELLDRYSFAGGSTTQTPVLGTIWDYGGDYHALSYFESQHLLALPIYSDAGWYFGAGDRSPLLQPGQGGLEFFRLDAASGITPLGLVKSDSLIERSITIGDQVYVISDGAVSAYDASNPTVATGTINFEPPDIVTPLFEPPQPMAPIAPVTPLEVAATPVIHLGGNSNSRSIYGPMPKASSIFNQSPGSIQLAALDQVFLDGENL
jgi:uncharacterized secreted protein with C-terminal beta-propeller domain